jgi:transposase
MNDEIIKNDTPIAELKAFIFQLQENNKQLQETNKALLLRIEELENRLKLNSNNSSKPPSSDGLKKKTLSLREKTNKSSGGQVDHKGKTLLQVSDPDKVIKHTIQTCQRCQKPLLSKASIIKRQTIDIVVSRCVVEHQAEVKICTCGCKNIAVFPKDVKGPVQFGANLKAFSLYLLNQFIPKDRLSKTFQDLFGISISDTTLMTFEKEATSHLEPFYQNIEQVLKEAPLKHLDETGFRIKKKTQWLHVMGSKEATHYRVHQKRGDLLRGIKGTVVHDFWKPYWTLENVDHVLCNAHHLRELNACIENKEAWAKKMKNLLLEAHKLEKKLPEMVQKIDFSYDKIVEEGFKYHEERSPLPQKKRGKMKRRKGHNFLIRLRDYKSSVLKFLKEPDIPFTNNLAEQDLRMMKLKQKISGCFRTDEGAYRFSVIRSFISTMRKQKRDIFKSLQEVIAQKDIPTFI